MNKKETIKQFPLTHVVSQLPLLLRLLLFGTPPPPPRRRRHRSQDDADTDDFGSCSLLPCDNRSAAARSAAARWSRGDQSYCTREAIAEAAAEAEAKVAESAAAGAAE